MEWIPLHVHSQYSILESTLSIKDLVKKAKEFNLPSVAMTDSGNLYGAVDFYKACRDKSIKPIIGCEAFLAYDSRHEKKKLFGKPVSFSLTLLAKDMTGYQNLCRLSSLGFLEGFYYRPRIDKEVLAKYAEGLVCLSGSIRGKIPWLILNASEDELLQEIQWFQNIFKEDFYFELQRLGIEPEALENDENFKESWLYQAAKDFALEEKKVCQKLLDLSKQFSIKTVATNDVHYKEKEDWKAHEILLNVQSGESCEIWERDAQGNPRCKVPNPKRNVYPSHEYYFKSVDEISARFQDCLEALETTKEIDEKCHLKMDFKTKYYPVYTPENFSEKDSSEHRQKIVGEILYKLCLDAIPLRYRAEEIAEIQKKFPNENYLDMIKKRLDYEYELISSKGLSDYLLIVYDFISWAKKQNIPVGPGRGSVVGSILSYLLGITDIEPLRFSLFFERFINPDRLAYPDIDVDICMDRRSEVIDYIVKKYGQERVSQIITFGTMKAKMAIKDVGRVLSIPLSKVNAIAKLVPEEISITLEKALKIDPELKRTYDEDDEAKRIIDLSMRIEGSIRNTSTHAAGMIISAEPLFDLLPLCHAKDSEMVVTQYAMKPVESVGMLKIDFLGLKTLTSLQKCVDFIEKNHQVSIAWNRLSLHDKKTFDLLNEGKTLGLFQLESSGMQDLIRKLHIDHFEEIIAVNALYRPGPMDMIPSYIQRKHGKEKIDYDHFLMEDILKETHGVMIYQEQVMQIASRLAGYTLAEGDVLRRAMGKKDKAEMEKQREKFLEGALKNSISEPAATKIFEKVERFASYGFNKSHAAAYAYLSYATAYFKAHYPIEWMAALMTSDQDDLSKVAKFLQEAKSMGMAILPPDVNVGGKEFVPTKEGIRFSMTAIRGMGSAVVDAIIFERERKGVFASLFDFIKRCDTQKVTKKNCELLVLAGAFDFTKKTREELFSSIEIFYERAAKEQKELQKGVMTLFTLDETQEISLPKISTTENPEKILEMQRKEKELLGFYLSGHPLDGCKKLAERFSSITLKEAFALPHDALFSLVFILEDLSFKISSKTQRKFALLRISDGEEIFELPLWPENYEKYGSILKENELYMSLLQIDKSSEEIRILCRQLSEISSLNSEENLLKLLQSFELEKKKGNPSYKKNLSPMKKNNRQLLLRLNAEKIKYSQILQIKKELQQLARGNQKISLEFYLGHKKIGKVVTEATWKADEEEIIGKKLQNLDNVLQVIFE